MTKSERAEVWSRKLELQRQRQLQPQHVESLTKAIESCNTELISDNYNPPVIEEANESL